MILCILYFFILNKLLKKLYQKIGFVFLYTICAKTLQIFDIMRFMAIFYKIRKQKQNLHHVRGKELFLLYDML